jgi:hypothetical protein
MTYPGRKSQWYRVLATPFRDEHNDMQILISSYSPQDCSPNDELGELQISVWGYTEASNRSKYSNWILTLHIPNLV